MTIKYTEKQTDNLGLVFEYIEMEAEDGTISFIPKNPANADYQAYLNKDKPKVEHLTEIIPSEAKTK